MDRPEVGSGRYYCYPSMMPSVGEKRLSWMLNCLSGIKVTETVCEN